MEERRHHRAVEQTLQQQNEALRNLAEQQPVAQDYSPVPQHYSGDGAGAEALIACLRLLVNLNIKYPVARIVFGGIIIWAGIAASLLWLAAPGAALSIWGGFSIINGYRARAAGR
jgi:hypothetical protein